MMTLDRALKDYIALRRALGFQLRHDETNLRSFLAFLKTERVTHITTELAIRWATLPSQIEPSTRWHRLNSVRHFAVWYASIDSRTEVPPPRVFPRGQHRKPPHIYTDEQIDEILRGAGQLKSVKGLRAHTYRTFFGLLAVTGMRVSEALGLDKSDVDLVGGLIHIRWAKFGKSRIVPVQQSTVDALRQYTQQRDRVFPVQSTPAFFISEYGFRIRGDKARRTFAKLSQRLGIRAIANGYGRGPRLHDMRHRFAARTLINWYRAGLNIEQELPKLATYLGHVHVNGTYWYLEAVPELLRLATDRILKGGQS